MKKVLATGANGFIGQAICKALSKNGYAVKAAVRSIEKVRGENDCELSGSRVEWIEVGEIGPKTDWGAALSEVEMIVHLAARVHVMTETAGEANKKYRDVNVRGTERLATMAAKSRVKRLIYLSSVKVNGTKTATRPFRETDQPRPQEPYSVSKQEGEEVLRRISRDTGLETVIVRPPLVYGPGVKGNFLRLLRAVDRGYPLPLAKVWNRRSLIGLGNLVSFIEECINHPLAAGETFLVADGEDISTPELIRRVARVMHRPARLLPFAPSCLRIMGDLLGFRDTLDRVCDSLVVDINKARKLLSWVPPYTIEQELQRTVVWYLDRESERIPRSLTSMS
jgi:nucleoside-diphosphate-sugar epimerase